MDSIDDIKMLPYPLNMLLVILQFHQTAFFFQIAGPYMHLNQLKGTLMQI